METILNENESHCTAISDCAKGFGITDVPSDHIPAGATCASEGLMVYTQDDVDQENINCMFFFPNNISEEQKIFVHNIISSRMNSNFSFSYWHNDKIYDKKTAIQILKIIDKILQKQVRKR